MRKPVQIIGTTLAATAIVGGSAAAASAHDFGPHRYGDAAVGSHPSFAREHSFGARGSYDPNHSYRDTARAGSTAHEDAFRSSDAAPEAGVTHTPEAATPFAHHRFARPIHQLSFAQRKAAIVEALTAADSRLTALQATLANAASNDPTGGAAKALTYVTQARTRVESLLAQVQAATTPQQLEAIFTQLHSAPFGSQLPGI